MASGHESPVTAVAYSPDGKLLAFAGVDRTIRLSYAQTGNHVKAAWHIEPILMDT
jgi:WD40 repeat protein